MKNGPSLLLLVLAGFLLGGLWLRQHDAQVRQVAALEASRDSLTDALGTLRTREAARGRQDSALRDSVVLWRSRAQIRAFRLDSLTHRAAQAETLFVATLPDSLKAGFQAVVASRDSLIAGLRAQVADLGGIVAAQERQLALRDTSLTELRGALAEAVKQRDAWRRQAKPPLWKALFRDAPQLVAAVGVGYLLGR